MQIVSPNPSIALPACSSDSSLYRLQFALDSKAYSLMSSRNVTLRLEFPSDYRYLSNLTSMPIQWNGITTSFQTGSASNPVLTVVIPPTNLLATNTMTIFASNCLLTPFRIGTVSMVATFSWVGGTQLTASTDLQVSAPLLRTVPSLNSPISSTLSCLDLSVIITCNYFPTTAILSLSDQRSELVQPTLVKLSGVVHTAVDSTASTITLTNLASLQGLRSQSLMLSVCSIPTPRFVGTYCGLSLGLGSGSSLLVSTSFCVTTTLPNDFSSVELASDRFSAMQSHPLSVAVEPGIRVEFDDTLEMRLAPDFSISRRP